MTVNSGICAQREVCPIIPSRLGLTQVKQLSSQFQLYLKFHIMIQRSGQVNRMQLHVTLK